MEGEVVYVGMDLGSHKTSAVASNGKRATVMTAVGWPKDHVARAMLGRDVVIGEETLKQRLALDVVRPFAKGALKYVDEATAGVGGKNLARRREAASLIVRHAMSMIELPPGVPVYGVVGAPSRATIENKQVVIDAVQASFDAVVIVAEPFAVAYGMNRLSDLLVVDIGAGTIDICPIYGTYPKAEDQVTLPVGGDAVDESLHARVRDLYPEAQLSLNMARMIKEKYGFVHDVNESVVISLPVERKPTLFDVTQPLKEACKVLVPPIVDGLREVIARFDPEFQRAMLDNILLNGGGSQIKGLDRLVEQALEPYGGGNVTKIYDSVFAGAVGALKLASNVPASEWQRLERAQDASSAGRAQRKAA